MAYKLNKPNPKHSNGKGYITKNGHTMFNKDIVTDLKQLDRLNKVQEALQDLVDNIERWIESGEATDSETSKRLYDNAVEALNPNK